jgi:16S rRNA pseudouridine516 synthase
MRLDKFFSESGLLTRRECANAARSGRITVNGDVCLKADIHIDENCDAVCLDGEVVSWKEFTYIMLNKPEGYVSSTDDGDGPCVLELLPPRERKLGLFPCGRLDKYTLGLMLLTNDGQLAHALLSPKKHVCKTYRYECSEILTKENREKIENGISIGSYVTMPCHIEQLSGKSGEITLREGKYHQIKRMFDAVGNKITALERISFGPLTLDTSLGRGEWRELTKNETERLRSAPNNKEDVIKQ